VELDLHLSTHSCANPFYLAHVAKPAKRQAAAQPVPAAVAQPVAAPIAPNGNAIFMFLTSPACHAKSIVFGGEL